MKLTRKQFFAALFAPLLAALGLKPAAKVHSTIGLNQMISTNISSGTLTPAMFEKFAKSAFQHRARMEQTFMFGHPHQIEGLKRYAQSL